MKRNGSVHERVSRYAHRDLDALYRELGIPANGFSEEQAEKSRGKYGSNVLTGRAADTVFYRLRRAFVNPFSIILLVLAGISLFTDVLLASNFSRNISTVWIILCMLLISGMIRFSQEMRAKHTADYLSKIVHSNVSVYRNGKWEKTSSRELVVGDRVRFTAGDSIPGDIRLTEAADLFVSQSIITGESAILEKKAQTLPEKAQTDTGYRNIVFMGSSVIGGRGEGIVLAVGQDTVYGGFSETDARRKNRFDTGANSIAWVLIRFMVILTPLVFVACGITKGNWLAAFLFALSVAVGLTPEMLPMVINACLARGSSVMGQKQTVVKNINAMQGFGSMDILCVDKTGTLTGDTLLLEYYMDVLGNESGKVLDFAYLNSCYHTGVSNHLDAAILKCLDMPGRGSWFHQLAREHPKLDELPFDHERKCASVLVKDKGQNLLIIKGDVHEVYRRCRYVEYKGEKNLIEPEGYSSVRAVVDEMFEDGMKVMAVAYRPFGRDDLNAEDERDFILLGYLAFFDAPKNTAGDAIRKLQRRHVEVRVLTGDRQGVAASVCRRLGIDTEEILTGEAIHRLTEDERLVRIEHTTVFAELSPKQKVEIVKTLQSNGHTVGFLGDGMNDLPAMVESDVGISVDTAAEAVREGADVILLRKDLNVLEEGILEGRKAFSNMSKYIRITASSNFGNIFSIVIASVFLPFLPMTSVQILLLNLLYDGLCLVLPWDYVEEETLSRPLEWSGRTLGRFMCFFGPLSSVFDILTFLFLFFVLCPSVCGGSFASLAGTDVQGEFMALFHTGWFLESMWTQVLILHLLRTRRIPFVHSRPSPAVMLVTMSGILLFTILTFTPLGGLIGLTAMPIAYFAFLIVVVALYLLLVTLAKGWYVKRFRELL